MTLEEYKTKCGVTYAFIADKCKVTTSTIAHIAAGRAKPGQKLAARIESATKKHVMRTNWYPENKKGKQ